jgi:predicted acylesterase/phospholipase RssA
LLVGWSAQGSRPEFDLVTGISAGALIAPFAFLGRDHDRELAGLFTSYSADQIYQANVLSGLFGGNALADSAPLARLIEHYVDGRFLRSIAAERAKGRFLLVGTTNLDAQRPVYWDMGKIAQKGNAQALDLFRRVLLASASIPGVFPPVLVEVQAGGHLYQEMHVDGGTTREVFFTIADFRFDEIDQAIGRKIARRLFIIRNGKIDPEYKAMPEATLAIAQRSLETLTKSRGIGDLVRMYARAKSDHIDYNLAAIPRDFDAPHPRPFDRAYMQALFERGLAMGRAGYPWAKTPPETIVEARR